MQKLQQHSVQVRRYRHLTVYTSKAKVKVYLYTPWRHSGGRGVDVYVQLFLTLTLYASDWPPHALATLSIQKGSQVLFE